MSARFHGFLLIIFLLMGAGCANITAPTGGKKDKTPPKLVSIEPADSLLNTRVDRIELHFDEYITVSDASKEVQLSPILPIAPTVTGMYKHVIVKIPDSLLEDNTTYRLTFGNAIKDLHEGNVFANYIYTFSTGAYFDSLQLHGTITDAATGLPGMEGVVVELYAAKESDSAVVRHKPKYVVTPDASGNFTFKGLPRRPFHIYALKDANNNLIYDGPGPGEAIGFADNVVIPGDTGQAFINIKVFSETPDSATKKSIDSIATRKQDRGLTGTAKPKAVSISYSVNVDTSAADKRTFDVNGPVKVSFNMLPLLNKDKVTLTFDSLGVTVSPPLACTIDSAKRTLNIAPKWWSENKVYTLRLVKGFAKDTAGGDIVPSRYTFRTKSEEDDYGRITMHIPAQYRGSLYLFRVMADGDSLLQKPINDSVIVLHRLRPAKYTFRIIVDRNHDGKWNTGDLFNKIQPEDVIPYTGSISVRPGFEYDQVFEAPKPKTLSDKRDKAQGPK